MNNKIIEAIKVANKIIKEQLEVKKGEEVLICTDPETDTRMVNALAAAIESCEADYTVAMMPIRPMSKAITITKAIESAMEAVDVYIGMTSASGAAVYNSKMKELLSKKRIRECSMVLRSMDNYIKGGALADYQKVYEDGKKLSAFWKDKKNCRIYTPTGTELTAEMISSNPIIECGIAKKPGETMAFSDGEVSVGPVENTMEGTLVLDGPICYFGQPIQPIRMKIHKGKVSKIIGGDSKIILRFEKMFEEIENSRNIAEIGIGLNPMSLFNGDFQEEKKARGTLHIAFGNGIYYGQSIACQVHIDAVLYRPTVYFDNQLIVSEGNLIGF